MHREGLNKVERGVLHIRGGFMHWKVSKCIGRWLKKKK